MTVQEFWSLVDKKYSWLPWVFHISTNSKTQLKKFSRDPYAMGFAFTSAPLKNVSIDFHPWDKLNLQLSPTFRKVQVDDPSETTSSQSVSTEYDIYYHKSRKEMVFKRKLRVTENQTIEGAIKLLETPSRIGDSTVYAVNAVVAISTDNQASYPSSMSAVDAFIESLQIEFGVVEKETWRTNPTFQFKTHLDIFLPDFFYQEGNPAE